ncbi:MAG: FGGY family carbohydrate kinase [Geminicoccaceae bacterium]
MNKRETGRAGPLLVGVDAGTTNTKAIIVDLAGRVVAEASEPTRIEYPRPEWAEYAAETLWEVTARAIRRAVAQLDDPRRIEGVAVASMAETAVPLDAKGAATGPAIAWFDKRTRAELALIEERVGPDRLFAISGLAPEPIFGLCKLLWHKRHRPESFARTVKWLNAADYLAWRLSGEMATDYSLASRTFALDLGTQRWSTEVLEAVGVDASLMAPLVRSGQRVGQGAGGSGPRHLPAIASWRPAATTTWSAGRRRRHAASVMLLSTGTTEAILMRPRHTGKGPRPRPGRLYAQSPDVGRRARLLCHRRGLHRRRLDRVVPPHAGSRGGGRGCRPRRRAAAARPAASTPSSCRSSASAPPHIDGHARAFLSASSTDVTHGCAFAPCSRHRRGFAPLRRRHAAAPACRPPREVRIIGGLTATPSTCRSGRRRRSPAQRRRPARRCRRRCGLLAGLGASLPDPRGRLRRCARRARGHAGRGDGRALRPPRARGLQQAYPTVRALHEAAREGYFSTASVTSRVLLERPDQRSSPWPARRDRRAPPPRGRTSPSTSRRIRATSARDARPG